MARNVTIQVLRGTHGQLQAAMPLALGEFFFATDSGSLFIGTPGVGRGYIQVADDAAMNETLKKILMELKSIRVAMVTLACEGGHSVPEDFDPDNLSRDMEITPDGGRDN